MFRYRLHLEDGSDAGEATVPRRLARQPAACGDAMLLAMIEISDLPRGPSDPDWDEAWRLATNLIAARISGGEAYSPSYEDVLGWAIRGQPADVAAKRLLCIIEAATRLATAGLALAADEPSETLDRMVRLIEEADGDDDTAVTP